MDEDLLNEFMQIQQAEASIQLQPSEEAILPPATNPAGSDIGTVINLDNIGPITVFGTSGNQQLVVDPVGQESPNDELLTELTKIGGLSIESWDVTARRYILANYKEGDILQLDGVENYVELPKYTERDLHRGSDGIYFNSTELNYDINGNTIWIYIRKTNKYVKKLDEKEMAERKTKSQKAFEDASKALYNVYGENAELTKCTLEDTSNLIGSGSHARYKALIHFPELKITNSNGKSIDIKDLYVLLFFRDATITKMHPHVYGLVTAYTPLLYAKHYQHSHLRPKRAEDRQYFTSFCLGSTPIAVQVSELSQEFNIDRFELFLHQLKSYVTWESLEGGPHYQMQNVGNTGSGEIQSHREAVCNTVLDNLIHNNHIGKAGGLLKLSTSNGYQAIDINRDMLGEMLLTEANKIGGNTKNDFLAYEVDGRYYRKLSEALNVKLSRQDLSWPGFKFKGEDIKIKLIEDKNKVEYKQGLFPANVDYIYDKIKRGIRGYIFQGN